MGAVYVLNNSFTDYFLTKSAVEPSSAPIFNVYPNPASETFTLEAEIGSKIVIFDIQGRIVKDLIAQSIQQRVDIGNFTSGVYLVRSNENMARLVKK
jgi:hypothetical protein